MLSIVIPTLNADDHLPACLDAVRGDNEIVVVDGGSADASAVVAEAAGARVVRTARGRGTQLRAGAETARGDWLLFLHADTRLGAGWRETAAMYMASRPGAPACFRFRLDDDAWQARIIERGVAARARLLGLPYGDQGLLVSRERYEAAGGYRDLPLMEDVDLVRRLRRVRVLDADAITSAARWRRDGWFRRSARNAVCLGLYRAGVPVHRIARVYSPS
ncbi:TIGR04283 family arsenosugar biosynthesis glycosyltransferase [Allosphingosinicella sp.]|uniref:TIGR04283 family arsenosugar biosynthesis glycosyltransferase n=1 Tax=Allosphingosinicella sp. TaxID=2823234 RepID=UPI002FC176C0